MKGEHITLSSTNPVRTGLTMNVEHVELAGISFRSDSIYADSLDWQPLDAQIAKDEALFSSKWTQKELDTLARVEARIEAQTRQDIGFWHWVYHHVFG